MKAQDKRRAWIRTITTHSDGTEDLNEWQIDQILQLQDSYAQGRVREAVKKIKIRLIHYRCGKHWLLINYLDTLLEGKEGGI